LPIPLHLDGIYAKEPKKGSGDSLMVYSHVRSSQKDALSEQAFDKEN